MRVLSLLILFLLVGFSTGCESLRIRRGGIVEGLPKLVDKFPRDVSFYVEKTERRVKSAFEAALRERGFEVAENERDSDVVVHVSVDAWEFNDAGFSGFGPRDDMELSVRLVDRRQKKVLTRARISVRSDFEIIKDYVRSL